MMNNNYFEKYIIIHNISNIIIKFSFCLSLIKSNIKFKY